MNDLFEKYAGSIMALATLPDAARPIEALKLWENGSKNLTCFYAPFEHVNPAAKLVVIGITPGHTQMNRALNAAASASREGKSIDEAVAEVKKKGSLSGAMRPNIVQTLNKLGYPDKLGIACSSELWGEAFSLVHFCALLKYPVFLKGRDYNGTPNPFKVPELRRLLTEGFAKDLQTLPADAELVPLGDFVASVLSELDEMGLVPQKVFRFEGRVVAPPHPSGANAESIALLLSDVYPERDIYLERMYRTYLNRRTSGTPQPEERYKAARALRWERMRFVRRAYGLDV